MLKRKTMGDYHDLYLKTVVLLLADVFQMFINKCLEYYGLDPCHYFSCPGLSWDAVLKITETELELIHDIDMHVFIKKGMRRSISYISERYSKANNKYVQSYDNTKPSQYITYLDANNLYGWAMSQRLAHSEFKWLNQNEFNKFDISPIGENSLIGYILEVDLEYLDESHELHHNYPLAPEKLEINDNMLKIGGVNKLIPNLGNKDTCVLHYRNLQLYLSLGMKLTKVHRILKFKQFDWLKKYIDVNTDKRSNGVNSFEKIFFKMMNNSVYGKTMGNLRKRVKVTLVDNAKDYQKYLMRPSFVSQKIFNKNFAAIHEINPALKLDKLIYVVFSILYLSKYLMYEFHYKYIKRKLNANLLFTDTDSLVYETETDDVYEDFNRHKNLFDFSDPKDSKLFDPVNKKVIDKIKDEFKEKIISQFVGLKSKMYSLIDQDGEETKKAKGVYKNVVKT